MVWLKLFHDLDSLLGYTGSLFADALVSGARGFRFNRKGRLPIGFVRGKQCELPSKVIEAGANAVGKVANQDTEKIWGLFLFNADDVFCSPNVVISRFDKGVALNKV